MTNARDAFASTGIHKKWLAGQVSNFDYIMALNTFSGRSFNDLRQYPVRSGAKRALIIIHNSALLLERIILVYFVFPSMTIPSGVPLDSV